MLRQGICLPAIEVTKNALSSQAAASRSFYFIKAGRIYDTTKIETVATGHVTQKVLA